MVVVCGDTVKETHWKVSLLCFMKGLVYWESLFIFVEIKRDSYAFDL